MEKSQESLIPITFQGDTLFLVEYNGEPYTPMKPIVEGMGLSWQVQHRKLADNSERWGIIEMVTPSVGGPQSSTCLPLRKLSGWLMTIHPNKVGVEIRPRIISYQNECDDVLWAYWSKGKAVNPRRTRVARQDTRYAGIPQEVQSIFGLVNRAEGRK